jgi:hypothetical protein
VYLPVMPMNPDRVRHLAHLGKAEAQAHVQRLAICMTCRHWVRRLTVKQVQESMIHGAGARVAQVELPGNFGICNVRGVQENQLNPHIDPQTSDRTSCSLHRFKAMAEVKGEGEA